MFCFEGESQAREITEPFRQIRRRINDLRENVLYGYSQHNNLSSALTTLLCVAAVASKSLFTAS